MRKLLNSAFVVAELREADLTLDPLRVVRLQHELIVDEALHSSPFDAHPDGVPFALLVVRARHVVEDLPGVHVRAIEAREPQLAAGWVEAVVFLAVVSEDEPGGPAFVVQLDRDGEFVRHGRGLALRDADAPPAEAGPGPFDAHSTGPLRPPRAHLALPFVWIKRADRHPRLHRHRVRLFEQRLQVVDGAGEREVLGDQAT